MTTDDVDKNSNSGIELEKDYISIRVRMDIVMMLIDGLRELINQWEYTEDFLISGTVRDDVLSRDCDDPDEARMIANDYQQVLNDILEQLAHCS